MLYGNSSVAVLITFCSAFVLVFGFENAEATMFKLTWWTLTCLILLARGVDAIRWRRHEMDREFDGRLACRRYIAGTITTGVMWSLYSLYMLQHADIIELACNIIIVSALAGGGATVLAAHRQASLTYTFILLLPYSLALTLSFENYKFLLGILGLCFGTVLAMTANRSARFTENALKFKNENEVLVHHMEEKIAQRTQQIYELSIIDPLTGLLNRTSFLSKLEEELQAATETNHSVAILFIDLDKFKKINDAIGHEAGDDVLSRTAKRLKDLCQENQLLCRWGGDEFVMVLPDNHKGDALLKARQIIDVLSQPLKFNGSRLAVGATIGISMFPEHSHTGSMLIRLADTAMYDQKSRSRSKAFVFSEQLSQQIAREHQLKAGLSQAQQKQQFRLVFHPIIDSKTGSVVALEALLRWKFGKKHVYPGEFIAIAEQYGMIESIGAWVLGEACRIASSWDQALIVNVNTSVMQLQDDSFVDYVKNTLKRHQLPANRLCLEITESVFATDTDLISTKIRALREMGVQISIDDFGTGYSSLSHLQELTVDTIKIDQSFVSNIQTTGEAIVRAIMDLSSSLNCSVIAEGVETTEQVSQLQGLGVQSLQGFHFSKPLEYDEVNGFILHQAKKPNLSKLISS